MWLVVRTEAEIRRREDQQEMFRYYSVRLGLSFWATARAFYEITQEWDKVKHCVKD